jgi:MFS family permease
MTELIAFRALQGIGAGGNFALAYIVVAAIFPAERRGKMMGLISFVWGLASILGPALGGFVVSYFCWRWLFYINVPLGSAAFLAILCCLQEVRVSRGGAAVDWFGAITLSLSVVGLLTAFLLGGRTYPWLSLPVLGLFALAVAAAAGFVSAEKRAREPLLALDFFRIANFRVGNGAVFFSSFAIFSLSAFSPLFIQAALGRTPAELGLAMVPLSLGWSAGALVCGQLTNRQRERRLSIAGSWLMASAIALSLTFSTTTPLGLCAAILAAAGFGMGLVSVGTLMIVQNSLDASDLGVATSSHQFARTLGGTIGIGASGSLVTAELAGAMEQVQKSTIDNGFPAALFNEMHASFENLLAPEVSTLLSADLRNMLQESMARGVEMVFWAALAAALVSVFCCLILPAPGAAIPSPCPLPRQRGRGKRG